MADILRVTLCTYRDYMLDGECLSRVVETAEMSLVNAWRYMLDYTIYQLDFLQFYARVKQGFVCEDDGVYWTEMKLKEDN